MKLRIPALAVALLILPSAARAAVSTSGNASSYEQDRQAILAMAGTFSVEFAFEETVSVQPGYERTEPYHTSAKELILVVADEPGFISLQHILVVESEHADGPIVIKHWRQDWRFQDTRLLVFRGFETWAPVTVGSSEVEGTWTQAVYQVDDAPRYESIGRWTHIGDHSTWESDVTWRPLPRREYTKRMDYDVIIARNRHTVTPDGWVHEQLNEKLVLNADGSPQSVIAHESGLNRYIRDEDFDFSSALQYWQDHEAFWVAVRAAWDGILSSDRALTIERYDVDGRSLAKLLEHHMNGVKTDREALQTTIRRFIVTTDSQ